MEFAMSSIPSTVYSEFLQGRVRKGTYIARRLDDAGYYWTKRIFDITVASVLLILLMPLLLLIALLVKIESPGPVFFVQKRAGTRRKIIYGNVVWGIQEFPFLKFRSMAVDADETLHKQHIEAYLKRGLELATLNDGSYKLKRDPRITRVGRIIRKASLDELPQLINVLRGEMSLVGPRPVPLYEYAGYETWMLERLAAIPGITGIWQVNGRCLVPFAEQIRMDIEYVRRQSLRLDIELLLLTVPAVISGRGAG
jgi:lipopolysaccharide/colanic/teichoic acid biosynthesis glycosyltransferase